MDAAICSRTSRRGRRRQLPTAAVAGGRLKDSSAVRDRGSPESGNSIVVIATLPRLGNTTRYMSSGIPSNEQSESRIAVEWATTSVAPELSRAMSRSAATNRSATMSPRSPPGSADVAGARTNASRSAGNRDRISSAVRPSPRPKFASRRRLSTATSRAHAVAAAAAVSRARDKSEDATRPILAVFAHSARTRV